MPPMELSYRLQRAVYWPKTGVDGNAEPTRGAPVELTVRWNDKQTEALDPQGHTITVDATVITDRTLVVGSLMWYGRLRDFAGTAGPRVMEVVTMNDTPDLKNRVSRHVAGVNRYSGTLPAPTA